MELDTQVSEYAIGPNSYAEGFSVSLGMCQETAYEWRRCFKSGMFQVTLHEKHEAPLMNDLSIGVSPGTQASIMLDKIVVSSYTLDPYIGPPI